MRYFAHISYNGINYHGWQRQRGAISVREVFETLLKQIFKEPIECIGCGRTDSQVHASQYFFHFDVKEAWDFDLAFRLNKGLPHDISVFDIIKVEDRQHARFDAISRSYDYFIHTYKDPFLNERSSLYLERDLDLAEMNRAVQLLSKYTDFYSFCLTPDKQSSTTCRISSAKLYTDQSADRIRFHITSNRFLRGMIRIIVAKLLEVGTRKISVEDFEYLLQNRVALNNTKLAYPQGLYLSKIIYPYLNLPPRTDLISSKLPLWVEVSMFS